jgi:hypothetical protein
MRRSTNSTRTYKRLRIARAGMDGDNLRALLKMLDPKARDDLRRGLILDQADRDAIYELYGWPQTFVDSPT